MESWRQTISQFLALFNNMAPSQRITLVFVPLLVLSGLGLVAYLNVGSAEEPLLSGKTFSAEELKTAESALRKGGFTQYRVAGQKILVPRSEAARYNAALITGDGLPDSFGEELQKAVDSNPFNMMTEPQRRDAMDLAKSRELCKMIKAIPFVEDARLLPQRPRSRGFSTETKMTAALGVRLRSGHELAAEFAQSLRQTVAGGFGMAATDVSVIDLRTGVAMRVPDRHDPSNNGYVDTIRQFKAMNQQTIAEALQYIPNVLVSVNVEIDNLVQSREQERKYDAKQFPYKNLEQTENETTNETGPGSEPGMVANQPRAVRQQAGIKNSRTVEKSTTTTDSVPIGTRIAERELAGLTPKSVQVAVAIPKDYYRSVLLKQGMDEADKTAFEAKLTQVRLEQEKMVREKVARLIPAPASGTAADAVSVTSYDRLETAEAPAVVSTATRIGEAVTQWGGPVGLALFALSALWMLSRSAKRAPSAPPPALAKAPAGKAAPDAANADEEELPREPTKRDKLQVLVKDNPEMAAAVLSRWLSPPK